MKKLVSVVLSLAMVMVLFTTTPLVAQAEENKKEIDGITYMLDAKKGVAQVVGADNSIATINILPEVDGKPVTTIGSWAFGECTSIKTVTIPDSVTEIGTRAFLGCTALADVKLGSGLTNIGALAFKDCIVLDEITIPKSVQVIGEMAFYNTAYYNNNDNWENSVLYIDDCLISAMKTQTDEEYNETVELELEGDYTIKDGTRIMADSAFLDCTSLTSITIPKSITAISEGAFCWCTSLTEFTIGDNITSIGGWSFANCQTLEKVTIGDSVTTIGENAFEGCSKLSDISIGKGVTSIGSWSFENTAYYDNLDNWEDGALYIDGCLIDAQKAYYDENFEPVVEVEVKDGYKIKDGTRVIAGSAFEYCTAITKLEIPQNITNIRYGTFWGCTALNDITIGDSVTSIDWNAFYDCKSLKTVTIPKSVTYIGEEAFGYYSDENWDTQKIDDFTIKGYTGSTAETYANDNKFKFVALEQPTQKGDANGDGKVSVADARKLVVALAKNDTQALLEFGDVNGDGKISVADVRKIVIAIAKGDFNF